MHILLSSSSQTLPHPNEEKAINKSALIESVVLNIKSVVVKGSAMLVGVPLAHKDVISSVFSWLHF